MGYHLELSNLIGEERFRPTDWLGQSPEKSNVSSTSLFATRLIRAQPNPSPGAYGMGPPAPAAVSKAPAAFPTVHAIEREKE